MWVRLFLQTVFHLARVVLIMAIVLAAVLYLLQTKMMYFPRGYSAEAGAALDKISWQAGGSTQHAYLLPPKTGEPASAPICVVFGGNATRALDWLGHCDHPQRRSWVVLFEYPGYGRNPGRMSIANARASLDAFIPELQRRLGPLTGRVHVAAHSLGCAVALEFARRLPVHQLTLIAPFTSMLDMGRRTVGWPLCEVLTERWDNRAALAAVLQASPRPERVRIIHGADDTLIPARMGRELATLHQLPFTAVPNAGHEDIVEALKID